MWHTRRFFFPLFVSVCIALVGCQDLAQIGADQKREEIRGFTWVRTGGNATTSLGMRVRVNGTAAVITDPASTPYDSGEIFWKEIEPAGKNSFSFKELGADGQYYEGVMTLVSDSVMEIRVDRPNGNQDQKWAVWGSEDNYALPRFLQYPIKSDARLENTDLAIDYIVPAGYLLEISAELVIDPGVVISLQDGAGIGVIDEGSIQADGTATSPIRLQGTNDEAGTWRGIHFQSQTVPSQLSYVTVSGAGHSYVYCCGEAATIRLEDAELGLNHVTLEQGSGYGIIANENATFANYVSNTITTHELGAAVIPFTLAGQLDGIKSTYTDNERNVVILTEQRVKEDMLLPALSIPYQVEGKVEEVHALLTIAEGTTLAFEENGGLLVRLSGGLNIAGTASNPVTLQGAKAESGYWRGIQIETDHEQNNIAYARISDAGGNELTSNGQLASLYFRDGQCKLTHTEITNGAGYGIATQPDFQFGAYQANQVSNQANYPLYVSGIQAGQLDGLNSDYANNSRPYVYIYQGELDEPTNWGQNNVPYLVEGEVMQILAPFGISAGVEVQVAAEGGFAISQNGTFSVEGNPGEPVIIKGQQDQLGFWRGIYVTTSSPANQIQYAQIAHAGSNYVICCHDKGAIVVEDGTMLVENSSITQSGGCGLRTLAGGTLNQANNTFSDNDEGNVCN